jgi:hypothetical protein
MTQGIDYSVVRESFAAPGQSLPLILQPAAPGVDLIEFAARNRAEIQERLVKYGAILFRGFPGVGIETFETMLTALSGEPLPYVERSSPRHEVGGQDLYLDGPPGEPGDLSAQRAVLQLHLAAADLLPHGGPGRGRTVLRGQRHQLRLGRG